MGILDKNIFKTIGVYKLNNDDKIGTVACGTYDINAYNYFRQFSNNIDVLIESLRRNHYKLVLFVSYDKSLYNITNIGIMNKKQYNSGVFDKRIIKDVENIKPYFKFLNPSLNLSPKNIKNSIYYDEPFFHLKNGSIVCFWKPSFEKKLGTKNWKIIDGCFLYEFNQDILILTDIAKRHEAAVASERLAIDCRTGNVSLRFSNVIDDVFYKCIATYNNGWVVQKESKIPVYGYKLGKEEVG